MSAAEELFDVVDAQDRVVDSRPRSEVHARGLLHRAVHLFLFRSDGRMLIHLRSPDKEEFPDVWTSSASGHVSAGESYDAAAVREFKEELGITPPLSALHRFAACPETCWEFTTLYSGESDAELRVDPVEIADTRWLTVDDIREHIREAPDSYSPAFRLLFAWFLRSGHC